jgi:hypothetical protein
MSLLPKLKFKKRPTVKQPKAVKGLPSYSDIEAIFKTIGRGAPEDSDGSDTDSDCGYDDDDDECSDVAKLQMDLIGNINLNEYLDRISKTSELEVTNSDNTKNGAPSLFKCKNITQNRNETIVAVIFEFVKQNKLDVDYIKLCLPYELKEVLLANLNVLQVAFIMMFTVIEFKR